MLPLTNCLLHPRLTPKPINLPMGQQEQTSQLHNLHHDVNNVIGCFWHGFAVDDGQGPAVQSGIEQDSL